MAFRPLISRPNFRALAIASLWFIVAYPAATWFPPRIGQMVALLTPVLFLAGIGFVVGYHAKRSPVMHGVLMGAFAGLVGIIATIIFGGLGVGVDIASFLSSLPTLLWMTIPGIAHCTLGAILGDFIQGQLAPEQSQERINR